MRVLSADIQLKLKYGTGVHVTFESLMKDNELKTTIKDLIGGSGRSYPRLEEADVPVGARISVVEKEQAMNGFPKERVAVETSPVSVWMSCRWGPIPVALRYTFPMDGFTEAQASLSMHMPSTDHYPVCNLWFYVSYAK